MPAPDSAPSRRKVELKLGERGGPTSSYGILLPFNLPAYREAMGLITFPFVTALQVTYEIRLAVPSAVLVKLASVVVMQYSVQTD